MVDAMSRPSTRRKCRPPTTAPWPRLAAPSTVRALQAGAPTTAELMARLLGVE
jgi:hypothetical protein